MDSHRREDYNVNDPVNHPSHYTSHPSGVEAITITEHFPFNIGNVFKYCWRAGLKDDNSDINDLKKALWYLNREINRRERLAK
jgi:thymidylate synthase